MKSINDQKDFATLLRENLDLSPKDFNDLFNTSKNNIDRKPQLSYERSKDRIFRGFDRLNLVDIRIL